MNAPRSSPGLVLSCAALACACGAAAAGGPGPAGPPVVLEARELSFTYTGFTTQYSCDGLRRHVEDVLAALGAAPGLKVRAYGCASDGRPERFPAVRISMQVPRPAPAAGSAGARPSQWKTVQLGRSGRLEPGDCELAEQIRDRILPLFAIRNVQDRLSCVPHQQSAGSLSFSVDVLAPAGAD